MTETSLTDEGPNPFVANIEIDTLTNEKYRTTRWTGPSIQLTLMSIEPGRDIGLEVHEHGDQFLRVEAGKARVQMGPAEDDLPFDREVAGRRAEHSAPVSTRGYCPSPPPSGPWGTS